MNLLYVGDNRNRENWGCRATSIGLHEVLSEEDGRYAELYKMQQHKEVALVTSSSP